MRFQEVAVSRSPLLVLDPREWFASWHGTGADVEPAPNRVPAVVRPTTTPTVTAEPMTPGDPRWPFAESVELVLVRTPNGLLAFFGRVRMPGGSLRRLPLKAATARLRVDAPGYAPVVLENVEIGESGQPDVSSRRFDMVPDPNYPFPTQDPEPTTLFGSVVDPGGTGIGGMKVEVVGAGELEPTTTRENGGWVLVLDRKTDRRPVASPIDVRFTPPSGPPTTVSGVVFEASRANRLARTSLRGVVRLADGRGLADATVNVIEFPVAPEARPRTKPDGTWTFCLGIGQPVSSDPAVEVVPVVVRIEAAGRPPKDVPVRMAIDRTTTVPAITV